MKSQLQLHYRFFEAHSHSAVNSICPVNNTSFILTGGDDSKIRLHNIEEEQVRSTELKKEHIGSVNSINTNATGEIFVSGGDDTVVLWDLTKQNKIRRYSPGHRGRNEIYNCQILNENLIVSCGTSRLVSFYDLRQPNHTKPVFSVQTGEDVLSSMIYEPNSHRLLVASINGDISILDLAKNELISRNLVDSGILSICLLSNTLLTTSESGSVELFSYPDFEYFETARISQQNFSYRINSDLASDYYNSSQHIISGSEDGNVKKWVFNPKKKRIEDLQTLEASTDLQNPISKVLSITKFVPWSNRLLCSGANGVLHMWENFL